MVYHAKSGSKKARTRINKQDALLKDALAQWKEEGKKPVHERRSLRDFSSDLTVPYSTLWRHINGKSKTRKNHLEDRQKLSPAEERKLVDLIKECADLGTPLNHADIRQYALRVLNRAKRKQKIDLGTNWVDNFLTRHHEELSTHWSSPLDMARANALTPNRVAKHYEIVQETMEKYGIIPENDYGMDETPIMLGRHAKTRVVGRAGTKQTYTICADGTSIAPTVIFAGEGFQKAWGENNPMNAQICRSSNGYTDTILCLPWIKNFDKQTKEKANSRWRRLFVDNCSAHCSLEFLEYAKKNKICVLGYPPHCTHALQGLDVACFGRLKQLWARHLNNLTVIDEKVTKSNFIATYHELRNQVFIPATIRSAWEKTGIWPFNPSVISPKMMAPSQTTSSSFTGPVTTLPPIVQDIREAVRRFRKHGDGVRSSADGGANAEAVSGSPPRHPLGDLDGNLLPPLTPKSAYERMNTMVTGTELEYVTNPFTPNFSSLTPLPTLPFSPHHHSEHPTALALAPFAEMDPENDTKLIDRLLEENRALKERNGYLEHTVDNYETTMILQDTYLGTAQKRLAAKERKARRKTKRQKLADNGKRDYTADEYLEAFREEENTKTRKEKLTQEKREWKEKERTEREKRNKEIEKEWKKYSAPYKLQNKRPPNRKPMKIAREPTPERFWELRKPKDGEQEEESEEESGEDDD